MAHKTLVGGTAYNITGGKSMVSGTTYNIAKGKTLVGGTGYNISFGGGELTAMLYTDGDFVFQLGDDVADGKTLKKSYTGFEDKSYPSSQDVPWYAQRNNIKNVYCNDEIAPTSMANWFTGYTNLVSFNNINFNTSHVTNMCQTYSNCSNLTGSLVCGNKVTNMFRTYFKCTKLTGSPVCGDNVTNMRQTYYNCTNLTGSPVCGNKVTDMQQTYSGCNNLTGSPVCGKSVIKMQGAYENCINLSGNAYFYSSVVNNVQGCFNNRSNSKRLNIYVPANSLTNTTILQTQNMTTLVYKPISYTNAGTHYYNTRYNIYIYPVENVAAACAANGD